jgi:acetyl esterase/lipase
VVLSRRGLIGLAGLTGLSGCAGSPPATPKRTASPSHKASPVRHAYGDDLSQFGDLYLPSGNRRTGTVVVIHGGFWQAEYTLSLGAPISADLARRGWTVWNLEYRRLGNGGGWPTTFEDVAAGIDHLAQLADVEHDHVVAVGHSAGGQLAVWAAARGATRMPGGAPRMPGGAPRMPGGAPEVRLRGAISQAGVLDLATAARTGLGGSPTTDLMGGEPGTVPERYAAVDPIELVPLDVPVRCVHDTSDAAVPISQSKRYVAAAKAAGGDASLVKVPGDHFTLIDPTSTAWKRTVALLPALLGEVS